MKQQEKYLDNDYNNSFWIKKNLKIGQSKNLKLFKFSKGNGLSKSLLVEDGLYNCVHYGEIYTNINIK